MCGSPLVTDDHLIMRVPATALSAPLIRLAATQLAAQDGFAYDRVEDIRVAVGEAVAVLARSPRRDDEADVTDLVVDFETGAAALRIVIDVAHGAPLAPIEDRSARILAGSTTTFRSSGFATGSPSLELHFDRHRAP